MKEQSVEPLTLQEFVEVYQECDMMQLWDFLVYNAYILTEED